MSDPPGRETEVARSRRRTTWYGHGNRAVVEKGGAALFIDDVAYAFADVSVAGLPILVHVVTIPGAAHFGVKSSAMVAWGAFVVVAALLRGGWVTPLGSSLPGWVSVTPSLAVLRLFYYNATLWAAAYAGGAVVEAGSPVGSLGVAALLAGVATGAFPPIAGAFYRAVSQAAGK